MTLVLIGAGCLGLVIGYITYRTLMRSVDKATIGDLAAVVGVIGGATVTKIYDPASEAFAVYAIGVLVGMVTFFAIYTGVNGWSNVAKVMGVGKPPAGGGGGGAPQTN